MFGSFTQSTGELIVSSITGDFTINATATILQYTISYNLTNCTSSNTTTTITYTQTYTTTLTANNGYQLPNTIQVTNANYNYNNQSGNLTIYNATGNVTITATAIKTLPTKEQRFTLALSSNYTAKITSLMITDNNKNLIIQANENDFIGNSYSNNYNMPLQPINNTNMGYNLKLIWNVTQTLYELNYKVTLSYWDIQTNSYKSKEFYTKASEGELLNPAHQYYVTINDFNLTNTWDYKYIANVTIEQLNVNPSVENFGKYILGLYQPLLGINIAGLTIGSIIMVILALWLWRWLTRL